MKTTKKILALVLCLALMPALIPAVYAQKPATLFEAIIIASESCTHSRLSSLSSGGDSATCHTYIAHVDEGGFDSFIQNTSGKGWSWDNSTNTLTLDNFTGSGFSASVPYEKNNRGKIEVPLNIVLKGTNTFTTKNYADGHGASIFIHGAKTTITGPGTLNVNSEENGIFVGAYPGVLLEQVDGGLTVKDGTTINIKAAELALTVSAELIVESGCTVVAENTSDISGAGGAGCLFVNGTFIASTNYKYEAFSSVCLVLGNGVTARFGSNANTAANIDIPAPNYTSKRYGLVSTLDFGNRAYAQPYMEYKGVGAPPPPANPLDSASSWAKEGITAAIGKGFVPADIQGSYTNVITRAEFCRMAVKWLEYRLGKNIDTIVAENGDPARMGHTFSDTTDPAILAAYRLGVTGGTSAPADGKPGTFNPSGQFSREQAATMIRNTCRAAGMDISNTASAGFNDIGTASSWAVDSINYVRNAGIMSGTGTADNPMFSPQNNYTREQSIITFNNLK
jgi:hypothetical protein